MFDKLTAAVDLFRKGKEVSNVEDWKDGNIKAGTLASFVGAVLTAAGIFFGWHVNVSPEVILGVCTGIVSITGVVLPAITSKRAGLLPAKQEPAPIEDHSGIDGVPTPSAVVAPEPVQPEPVPGHKGKALIGGEYVDSGDVLAGLDTTYRG